MSGLTYLPAAGRKGKAPPWPDPKPSLRELEVWRRLWRLPQAVMWERMGFFDGVAHYVRLSVRAEAKPTGVLLGEVRQLEDRWGLNPLSMLRLRWVIEDEGPAEPEGVLDIRDRLQSTDHKEK